ncbi:hypothetical protein N657DRAFT_631943 [Parathielavia appendiculata]|uniref:Uncharacterized protein n=1 Tax=Parathielavia appendiculata TaxID=2587402 RepID=A0AAN6Z5D9_9PEZI|nr:hypothetical protein N657DRAFT_631943 [Parathielavia appendiculata]
MLSPITLSLAASSLGGAASHTIPVSAGKNGLTSEPNEIHAAEGIVVAGNFHNACRPAENNGFFSDFFPTQNGTVNSQVFRITINHTNPIPIHCSQNTGQHCKNEAATSTTCSGSASPTTTTTTTETETASSKETQT